MDHLSRDSSSTNRKVGFAQTGWCTNYVLTKLQFPLGQWMQYLKKQFDQIMCLQDPVHGTWCMTLSYFFITIFDPATAASPATATGPSIAASPVTAAGTATAAILATAAGPVTAAGPATAARLRNRGWPINSCWPSNSCWARNSWLP